MRRTIVLVAVGAGALDMGKFGVREMRWADAGISIMAWIVGAPPTVAPKDKTAKP